jgi:hypothetical protein
MVDRGLIGLLYLVVIIVNRKSSSIVASRAYKHVIASGVHSGERVLKGSPG